MVGGNTSRRGSDIVKASRLLRGPSKLLALAVWVRSEKKQLR